MATTVDDAFLVAYRRGYESTVRLAFVLTADASVAEDVAHGAWVAAYRRHQRSPIEDVQPFVRRAVINAVRSRARRRVLDLAFVRAARSGGLAVGSTPMSGVEDVVDRLSMVPLLQQLPNRMRTCIALRFYADLSVTDTAKVMGVSEGTVKSTTAKALARLRELWGEADG